MQNLTAYCCSRKHLLSFITEYTREVALTHFILTAVTQSHARQILRNLHKRQTKHYVSIYAVFAPYQCCRFTQREMSQSVLLCTRNIDS